MDIRKILENTFVNSEIPINIDELKMGDIEEWDSLGNFSLVLAVERHFQIQFRIDQLDQLTSVPELTKAVDRALSEK